VKALSDRKLTGALVAALVVVAAPTSALAHDTYVDRSDGTGSGNDCEHKANPCFSLTSGIDNAGEGDTIFVGGDPAVYESPHVLGDKKSIVHKNFSTKPSVDTSGKAILDTGSNAQPALHVTSKAGVVRGLTIRSETLPLKIEAQVKIVDDRFDEDQQIPEEIDIVGIGVNRTQIRGSTFIDPTPLTASNQAGIYYEFASSGGLRVTGNRFKDFQIAVRALGGAPLIKGNTITGTHAANGAGAGITIEDQAFADIRSNVLRNPDISIGAVDGIDVFSSSDSDTRLVGNLISGYQRGVRIASVPSHISLAGNVYRDNAFTGLTVTEAAPDAPRDAKLSNETFWNPGASQGEVDLVNADIKMNSTIIGPAGLNDVSGSTCSISYSRGPTKNPGGDGCEDFKTTKNPKLKADHYHLKPDSPMIDAGDPQGHKSFDIDGDRRPLDGTGNCHGPRRRDIGADEFRC
jgi:hypothetical protein